MLIVGFTLDALPIKIRCHILMTKNVHSEGESVRIYIETVQYASYYEQDELLHESNLLRMSTISDMVSSAFFFFFSLNPCMLAETNHRTAKSLTVILQPDLITPRYIYITFTLAVHVNFCMCIESIRSVKVFTHTAPYNVYCTILEV